MRKRTKLNKFNEMKWDKSELEVVNWKRSFQRHRTVKRKHTQKHYTNKIKGKINTIPNHTSISDLLRFVLVFCLLYFVVTTVNACECISGGFCEMWDVRCAFQFHFLSQHLELYEYYSYTSSSSIFIESVKIGDNFFRFG